MASSKPPAIVNPTSLPKAKVISNEAKNVKPAPQEGVGKYKAK
jgi:hypothetical protein